MNRNRISIRSFLIKIKYATQHQGPRRIPATLNTSNAAIAETNQLARASLTPPPPSLKDIALSSAIHAKKTRLPNHFAPNCYTVLCGRGKDHYNWAGNRRFRVIVSRNLERYSGSRSKAEKTRIVMDVVELIHDCGGRFAKRHVNGDWYDIGYDAAREKVGALFRDALQKKLSDRAGRSMSSSQASSSSAASPRASPGTLTFRQLPDEVANPTTSTHDEGSESDSDSSHSFHPEAFFPF